MIKYWSILFFLWAGICQAQESILSTAEAAAFKSSVEQAIKDIKTIRTDFIQEKHMAFLTDKVRSRGEMYLVADGRLKWAYLEPNRYSLIFQGDKVIIDDNGKKSAIDGNQKLFGQLSALISGSVRGDLFNDSEFTISFFKVKENVLVKLLPKNKTIRKYIKEVHLIFPPKESTVSEVKLVEPSGDYTLLKFINKQLNVTIDEGVFNQ